MKIRFINRILIVMTMAVLLVPEVIAQDSPDDGVIKAIKGIQRIYSLPEDAKLSYFWSYKDEDGAILPISGDLHKITFAFPEEGEYTLSVYGKDKDTDCFSESTEIKILVLEAGFEVELGKDRWICEGDTVELAAQVKEKHLDGNYDDLKYEWIGSDSKDSSIRVYESGTYQVKVTDKYGNSVYDVVNVDVFPTPVIDLGDDIIINKGKSVTLSVDEGFEKYEWSTGDNEDKIEVRKHGKYWLTVTDINKCTASDSIRIFYKGESTESGLVVSLPTAFSPNNDGVNDILKVRGDLHRVKKLTYVIYRKDGLKVFETTNISQGWDGKHEGEEMVIDGYIYFLKIVFDNDEVLTKQGSVSLLR